MTPFALLLAALAFCMSLPASTTPDEPNVRRAFVCAWADDATSSTPRRSTAELAAKFLGWTKG